MAVFKKINTENGKLSIELSAFHREIEGLRQDVFDAFNIFDKAKELVRKIKEPLRSLRRKLVRLERLISKIPSPGWLKLFREAIEAVMNLIRRALLALETGITSVEKSLDSLPSVSSLNQTVRDVNNQFNNVSTLMEKVIAVTAHMELIEPCLDPNVSRRLKDLPDQVTSATGRIENAKKAIANKRKLLKSKKDNLLESIENLVKQIKPIKEFRDKVEPVVSKLEQKWAYIKPFVDKISDAIEWIEEKAVQGAKAVANAVDRLVSWVAEEAGYEQAYENLKKSGNELVDKVGKAVDEAKAIAEELVKDSLDFDQIEKELNSLSRELNDLKDTMREVLNEALKEVFDEFTKLQEELDKVVSQYRDKVPAKHKKARLILEDIEYLIGLLGQIRRIIRRAIRKFRSRRNQQNMRTSKLIIKESHKALAYGMVESPAIGTLMQHDWLSEEFEPYIKHMSAAQVLSLRGFEKVWEAEDFENFESAVDQHIKDLGDSVDLLNSIKPQYVEYSQQGLVKNLNAYRSEFKELMNFNPLSDKRLRISRHTRQGLVLSGLSNIPLSLLTGKEKFRKPPKLRQEDRLERRKYHTRLAKIKIDGINVQEKKIDAEKGSDLDRAMVASLKTFESARIAFKWKQRELLKKTALMEREFRVG